MGKSYTPRNRVEYTDQDGTHVQAWQGITTHHALEQWRQEMNRSFLANGVNAHLVTKQGAIPHIRKAKIIDQKTGKTKAETTAPMFEIVG